MWHTLQVFTESYPTVLWILYRVVIATFALGYTSFTGLSFDSLSLP